MGNPTRFPAGVSNNRAGSIMGNLPVVDRNNLAIYQNDFFQYAAGDWTVVAGGAGSGSALSSAILGGALALTWGTSGTQSNTLAGGAFSFKYTRNAAHAGPPEIEPPAVGGCLCTGWEDQDSKSCGEARACHSLLIRAPPNPYDTQ